MVLALIFLIILSTYFIYLIKKINKRIDNVSDLINLQLEKNKLYLLDEVNNKFKSNKELLLKKLKEINIENQQSNNKNHEQLISNEFKKLRSDINKDLDDIVESVKNIKVF